MIEMRSISEKNLPFTRSPFPTLTLSPPVNGFQADWRDAQMKRDEFIRSVPHQFPPSESPLSAFISRLSLTCVKCADPNAAEDIVKAFTAARATMAEVEGEMRAKCAELKYDEGEVEKYWDGLVRLPRPSSPS